MDDVLGHQDVVPILLLALCAALLGVVLVVLSRWLGPKRSGAVKQMPYESGVDPVHDARRRFDVRFHLVAIVFLIFDVELLFLYPWAVASRNEAGLSAVAGEGGVISRGLVFGEVMVFLALLAAGFGYVWRRGVFRWR